MSGPGIDYGLGQTNIDKETGIRFGVISQHTVGAAWYEGAEPDYGTPQCPKCNESVVESNTVNTNPEEDDFPKYHDRGCKDYVCTNCKHYLDSSNVFPEEPHGWFVKDGEYEAVSGFDNTEIFITKSPYFTYASFCSPCAPGAGNLNSAADPDENEEEIRNHGVKTYALDRFWFEGGKAPYPVFDVETGERVPDTDG